MASLLDRVIAAVSPKRAQRRASARLMSAAVAQARMAYDGATISRRSQGWRVVSTDANAEGLGAQSRLRDVARDMVRNNPHATRGKAVLAGNIVGTGIIPSAQAKSKRRRKQLEDLLKAHFDTTACDARGQTNLYGLQLQAVAAVVEGGEALIRWRPRRAEDKLPLPFQLEVLEGDYLDSGKDGKQPNGNSVVQGVEYDLIGRRVAYWLFDQHPGSYFGSGLQPSKRVPASAVAHIYRVDRPGQARGITWFAPVIVKMRDLADYADAQLVRQKVAACFAAFIQTEEDAPVGPDGQPAKPDGAGPYPVESLEPGMIQRLKAGESVTFGKPPEVGEYSGFKRAEMLDVAAGLGVSYEALTGDLSGTNFASGRMGWLEFQRTISTAQNFMVVPMLCAPIARWFMEAAAVVLGDLADATLQWTPPRREMINPKEEVAASRDAIRAGLSSRPNEQRKLGFDPEDLDAEIAEGNTRADANGLILDSDPRYRAATGNAVGSAVSSASQADPSLESDGPSGGAG